MNKSIKRTMGLVLALFVAVSMCVDISGVFADETNTNDQNTKVEAQEVNENEQPKSENNHGVNPTPKFSFSNAYTSVSNQSIHKVTFDRNFDNPNNPNTVMAIFYVYDNKSLNNNCFEGGCFQRSLPTRPTRKGYEFVKWNKKQDGTGEDFTEDTIVTDDITVYAQWEEIKPVEPIDPPQPPPEKYYKVTYDPNGGNWDGKAENKVFYVREGFEYPLLEAPAKEGYRFLYWKENSKQYKPGEECVIKSDHEFIAEWELGEAKPEPKNPPDKETDNPPPKPPVTPTPITPTPVNPNPVTPSEKYYTITVDPSGGNWNGDTAAKTQQFKENEGFKLPEAPTKDGYTFLYWKGSKYQPGQVYVVTENHTFTAVWEPNKPAKVRMTPQTGDSSDILLYAGLTALMSVVALLILKKKRSYK